MEAKEEGPVLLARSSWLSRLNPLKRRRKPPVPSERAVSPEFRAGFFSLLTFEWMSPLMSVSLSHTMHAQYIHVFKHLMLIRPQVGYQRPPEMNDIWRVNPNRTAPLIAARLQEAFDRRVERKSKSPLAGAILDTFKTDILHRRHLLLDRLARSDPDALSSEIPDHFRN